MKVRDILVAELKKRGAQGLCTIDCGCDVDDLAPCGEAQLLDCVPAIRVKVDIYREKEIWYVPLEGEEEKAREPVPGLLDQ